MSQTSTTAVDPAHTGKRLGYGALDLNHVGLASFVLLLAPFPGDLCWRLLSYFWLPEAGVKGLHLSSAFRSACFADPHLTICPEGERFVPFVLRHVAKICSGDPRVHVAGIAFDRWRLSGIESYRRAPGVALPEIVGCSMGSTVMEIALNTLESFRVGDDLRCEDNRVLTHCFDNLQMSYMAGRFAGIRQGAGQGPIGGAVAALMAINLSRGVIDPPSAVPKWRQEAGTGGSHACA